jgi:TolB protein
MKQKLTILFLVLAAAIATIAQQADIREQIVGGQQAAIAVPDLRGTGGAEKVMNAFNQTLFSEIQNAGVFKMVSKSSMPLTTPQQPGDFKADRPANQQGLALADWANPPVNANYLAMGYTSVVEGRLVLSGWLLNVQQPNAQSAQLIGKRYFGSLDEDGAKAVAREFAADILQQFGVKSLAGTRVFFVSDRTGTKEIWSMDYDGNNQKQFTSYRNTSIMPSVSPDGTKIAFTSFLRGQPEILVHSTETARKLPFYNQNASMNANADFTPDGSKVVFSSTASGQYAQIYAANADGSNLQRLTNVRAVEVTPKINPKTGNEIVFVSGRSGTPQIYRMNMEGGDIERLSSGEGEAVQPAWHPEGRFIAFASTRGFEPGNYNIFIMDVATRQVVQLTHGAGRNENPQWAPDGRHLVFSSRRGDGFQIYTMLADGTQVQKLTSRGNNTQPVWAKGVN